MSECVSPPPQEAIVDAAAASGRRRTISRIAGLTSGTDQRRARETSLRRSGNRCPPLTAPERLSFNPPSAFALALRRGGPTRLDSPRAESGWIPKFSEALGASRPVPEPTLATCPENPDRYTCGYGSPVSYAGSTTRGPPTQGAAYRRSLSPLPREPDALRRRCCQRQRSAKEFCVSPKPLSAKNFENETVEDEHEVGRELATERVPAPSPPRLQSREGLGLLPPLKRANAAHAPRRITRRGQHRRVTRPGTHPSRHLQGDDRLGGQRRHVLVARLLVLGAPPDLTALDIDACPTEPTARLSPSRRDNSWGSHPRGGGVERVKTRTVPRPNRAPVPLGSLQPRPGRAVRHGERGGEAERRFRAGRQPGTPVRIAGGAKCVSDPHVVCTLRYGCNRERRGLCEQTPARPPTGGSGRVKESAFHLYAVRPVRVSGERSAPSREAGRACCQVPRAQRFGPGSRSPPARTRPRSDRIVTREPVSARHQCGRRSSMARARS